MPTDAELLQSYARDQNERAFAELVQRHLGLVYSAALRRTGGRSHLAGEIAQKVFCDLARKAAALTKHPVLTGWLYRSTRYAALDAIRAEMRRLKLAQSFVTMPDFSSGPEQPVDWEQLRPVLDEAMDQLRESDRTLMLLRFFNGLSFAEVGARLGLNENTARMRTERALDALRGHLIKRGVTSTSAALGLLLTNQAFATAPTGLATTVTAAGLAATTAATGSASIVATLYMSKITIPALSAVLAAGLTTLVWTSVASSTRAKELAFLRQENARLIQSPAPGASAASVASVANEFAAQTSAQAAAITRALNRRNESAATSLAASASTSGNAQPATNRNGHRDRGRATPHDAFMSFAWAADTGEIGSMAKLLWFENKTREKALAVLATMPDSLRAQYRTPEELYAFFFTADALVAPPPGADLIEGNVVVDLSPGRVVMRRPGAPPNQYDHEFQQTSDGWKYVVPEIAVDNMPKVLANETLAKLGAP